MRFAVSSLALLMLTVAVPAQAGRLLVPHRAVYDLDLGSASEKSGITSLSGRLVYEFNGSACDGYTAMFRFVTQIQTQETSRLTDQQTTTYEDADGKSFDFVTRSFVDQQFDKELKGSASATDKGLKVRIDKPASKALDLDRSQFPTQHLIDMLDRADNGETFYETTLFDGSEDADKIMTTTVIMGKKGQPKAEDPELSALAELKSDQIRPVDIAYFDPSGDGGEETPVYRISFKLHDNGITRDLVMDYGDFSMTGKLTSLEMLKASDSCTR